MILHVGLLPACVVDSEPASALWLETQSSPNLRAKIKNEKKKKNEMRIFESYQVGTDASFDYHQCDEGVRGIRVSMRYQVPGPLCYIMQNPGAGSSRHGRC